MVEGSESEVLPRPLEPRADEAVVLVEAVVVVVVGVEEAVLLTREVAAVNAAEAFGAELVPELVVLDEVDPVEPEEVADAVVVEPEPRP